MLKVLKLGWVQYASIARLIVPPLLEVEHKGSMGRIAVIGGSKDYTGAPYYAAVSALKTGADLSWVFCSQQAAIPIKSYSPELMVSPFYEEMGSIVESPTIAVAPQKVTETLPRLHALLIGPGMGRNTLLMDSITTIVLAAKKQNLPLIFDADGLWWVTQNVATIAGYQRCILTPNKMEFDRLVDVLKIELRKKVANLEASRNVEVSVDGGASVTATVTDTDSSKLDKTGDRARKEVSDLLLLLDGCTEVVETCEVTERSAHPVPSSVMEDNKPTNKVDPKTLSLSGQVHAVSRALGGITILLKGPFDMIASAGPMYEHNSLSSATASGCRDDNDNDGTTDTVENAARTVMAGVGEKIASLFTIPPSAPSSSEDPSSTSSSTVRGSEEEGEGGAGEKDSWRDKESTKHQVAGSASETNSNDSVFTDVGDAVPHRTCSELESVVVILDEAGEFASDKKNEK